jgi:hypothetical protein
MSEYRIPVPGRFLPGVALLDLETEKVPAPAGFRMANGEPLRRRWSIVMAGLARDGEVVLFDVRDGREADGLADIGAWLAGASEVVYWATREFDEMICRGRFTNARRAHEPRPFFPAVPGAESLVWRNLLRELGGARNIPTMKLPRAADDAPSKGVTAAGWDRLAVHLLRDVAELILLVGSPDPECYAWCVNVMVTPGFALSEIYGPGD